MKSSASKNRLYFISIMTAMVCITTLEIVALSNGIDGALLMSSMAILGGLAGYEVKRHH